MADRFSGAQVVVVDDDAAALDLYRRTLEEGGFAVRTAAGGEAALALLAERPAEAVVSDVDMPGMDGPALLRRVQAIAPDTYRILLTEAVDERVERASVEGYIDRFLPRQVPPAYLRIAVRSAVQLHRKVLLRTSQLEQAKHEWEESFDAIRDPLAIVSRDRQLKRANRAYAEAGKRPIDQIVGQKCHEVLFARATACENCPLDRIHSGREQSVLQIGKRTWRVSAWPLKSGDTVCSYRDITADEESARQMIHSAKLTAAGQLAAGVAHEVNNPLASILAFSQLMKDEPGRSPSDFEALRLISSAALRCKHIVETLLRFVRRSESDEKQPADLNYIVDEAGALMKPQIKGLDVQLTVEHPKEQTWVEGNANQLAQVAINLLQNAVHAVGLKGKIRLFAGPRGEHMVMSVSDDGPGIPPEVRPRIFEPFFTTKAEGVGTGLGLSIVHRIVEDHGGAIVVESEPGQGATFNVVLPPLKAGP
jgi:two-component system NtrC family sensor kinase